MIKDILRLKMDVRLSHEQIARSLILSKGVVGKYVGLAKKAGLDWSSVGLMNEAEIDQRLRTRPRQPSAYVLPDYGRIHLRLSRRGASLMREWQRYNADSAEQKIYRYTQFCEHYHAFVRQLGRSLRQVHRAGEKMFANFSNSSIPLSEGGDAHIFLASMGASRYAFACATTEETATTWIRSADRALHFYGGVPRLIISEGSTRTIPSENTMVLHFARHYGTSVLLSLPLDPKQKAQAALPVKSIERWILRCLRQRKFATIEEVEAALQPWLDRLNHHLFRNLPASRASAFAKLDSPTLSPLPAQHYEIPVSAPDLASTEIRRPGLNNESGAKVPVAESATDIRTETAPREQKELFPLVLDSITDGFFILNADARFIYVNAAAQNMLSEQGVNADDLIGKQYLSEVFPEARDDESGRGFRRAMSERIPVEVENFFVPFSRWYLIRFFPVTDDGLAILFQDISERKCFEAALRESETRFRALAEASPGLIWQVDSNGNAVYMNPHFRELLGKPLKQLMGTAWHSMIHPDDLLPYVAALDKAVRQHGRLLHRVRVKRTDGEWRRLETNALPWFTSKGVYAGHVGISVDITEVVETER